MGTANPDYAGQPAAANWPVQGEVGPRKVLHFNMEEAQSASAKLATQSSPGTWASLATHSLPRSQRPAPALAQLAQREDQAATSGIFLGFPQE